MGGAVLATLAIAGCGGSSSAPVTGASGASGASGENGSTGLSKAAFIKQADQICAEANSAIDSLSAGTSPDQSFQVSQELDITRSELQSLQALTPPQENRGTLNNFLAGVKNEVDALSRANTAVQSGGDTSSADAELATARQNAESAATQYGMKDCGSAKARHTQQGGATTTVPPTTTAVTPTTPTTTTPVTPPAPAPAPAPAPPPAPPSGGTGGGTGGTGGSSGGSGNGGTGGSGGVTP